MTRKRRTTRRVRVRLDLTLRFDRDLDSVPRFPVERLNDALIVWLRMMGVDEREGCDRLEAGAHQHMSASDWAREMTRLRTEKPRPLHKRYGPNPTAEQITRHKAEEREWSRLYRHASKMQKRQLAIDNAEFRRRHG